MYMLKFLFICVFYAFIAYSQQSRIPPTKIVSAIKFDKTPPLKNMRIIPAGTSKAEFEKEGKEVPNKFDVKKTHQQFQKKANSTKPAIQSKMGTLAPNSAEPINNWEGIHNLNGVYPPDTQGDVGPDNYIQMVNLSFQIWDKSGTSLYGSVDNSTLWNGFGDPWDGSNDGDPVVLYDKTADRWIFTQFALPNYPNGPFYILIAVTETGNPLGSWYRYGFEFDDMPDYPKFGIWPDGYYMTVNQFASGSGNWAGVGVAVFERDKILNGDPNARMVFFNLLPTDDPYSMLPSDFDGPTPPAGTPNYMVYMNDDAWGYPTDQLRIYECHVDWNTTANSTLTHTTTLSTDSFDSYFSGDQNNIRQPGTNIRLEGLSDRLMYRLQYRNFGSYQTLVTNHTVDVGNNQAGIRWYELRYSSGSWNIYQQGTYAPDATSRWMGSVAMDGYGNIALGYSISSKSVYPSIKYVGRYKNDPLGEMTITEKTIMTGAGFQTGTAGRWGDYSMMAIDPVDDATFWYTNEYIQTTGSANWQTRVASFTLGFDLSIKVFLEGAYNSDGDSMRTNLNSAGCLPAQQSYNLLNYSGIEKVGSNFFSTHTDLVDWILVELRTGTSSSTIVAQRAGFLKSDGMIVGLDGVSPLRFGLPAGDYYIVVKHRNHLAIMSANPVSFSAGSVINYNFTISQDKAYGTNPMTSLGGETYGMIAGDTNGDGGIGVQDYSKYKVTQGQEGYDKIADFNCDGGVGVEDYSLYKLNQGKETSVP